MVNSRFLLIFLALLLSFCVNSATAFEIEQRCFSCESIQHAANLTNLERRLQQSNPQTLAALDEEARKWFSKFQEGGFLFDGWQEISEDVVENTPSGKKIHTKITMLALGMRIGCEWSKDNDVRKISTKMLKEWGAQIRATVATNPDQIPRVIRGIEGEVDTLLAVGS